MADFVPNESLYRSNPFAPNPLEKMAINRDLFENLFAGQLSGKSPPQWDDPKVPRSNGTLQTYYGHGADAAFNSAVREGAHQWERPYSFGIAPQIMVPLASGKVRVVSLDDLGVPRYSTEMTPSDDLRQISEDISNNKSPSGRVYRGVLPSHMPTPDMTNARMPSPQYSPSPGPSPVPMPMPRVMDPVQRQQQLRQLW